MKHYVYILAYSNHFSNPARILKIPSLVRIPVQKPGCPLLTSHSKIVHF